MNQHTACVNNSTHSRFEKANTPVMHARTSVACIKHSSNRQKSIFIIE